MSNILICFYRSRSRSVEADRNVVYKFQTLLQSKSKITIIWILGAMNNIFKILTVGGSARPKHSLKDDLCLLSSSSLSSSSSSSSSQSLTESSSESDHSYSGFRGGASGSTNVHDTRGTANGSWSSETQTKVVSSTEEYWQTHHK